MTWAFRSTIALVITGFTVLAYNACSVGGSVDYGNYSSEGNDDEAKASAEFPISYVGWVANSGGIALNFNRADPAYQACPSLYDPATNMMWGAHGAFCYEPSGLNGLYLPTALSANDVTLRYKNFIFNGSQPLATLRHLSQLGTLQKHPLIACYDATLTTMVGGSFNYAFARLFLPSTISDDEIKAFRFLNSSPDDGTILIVNGNFAGNTSVDDFRYRGMTEENIALHTGKSGIQTNLKRGWNDLIFVLVDTCKGDVLVPTVAGKSQIVFKSQELKNSIPHVVQIRIKNIKKVSGTIAVSFRVFDQAIDPVTATDEGFLEFNNLPVGTHRLTIKVNGQEKVTENVTLPALSTGNWIHRFEFDL